MPERKKICFQVLDAYSLFDTNTHYPFGGAEFRAVTLLKELQKLSFEVSAVVRDYGQGRENHGGIRVYPHPYHTTVSNSSVFKRMASLKWSGAAYQEHLEEGVYEEIDADIYCAFEITSASLRLARYCSEHKKRFFLFIASNGELAAPGSQKLDIMKDKREIASELISRAHKIFVQNSQQESDLQQHYHKKGILLKNPITLHTDQTNNIKKYDLVWIGKSNVVKRPELFLQLARLLPDLQCCMIMNMSDPELHRSILAQKPQNIEIIEHLPVEETEEHLSKAKVFVSTSLVEGFPNTFLQAAKYHVPVVSMLIDPEGLFSQQHCGICTGDDLDALKKQITQLLADEAKRTELSNRFYQYVTAHHEAGRVSLQLAAHFAS